MPFVTTSAIGALDQLANQFADFVATELIPRVRAHYNVTTDPKRTVAGGTALAVSRLHTWVCGTQGVWQCDQPIRVILGARPQRRMLRPLCHDLGFVPDVNRMRREVNWMKQCIASLLPCASIWKPGYSR